MAIELSVLLCTSLYFSLVPMAGVEPARPKSPPPQDGVSTNFTTSANLNRSLIQKNRLPRKVINQSIEG